MSSSDKHTSPHQCLLHDGASPRQLSALATVMHTKLQQNYRCFYCNSPTMIAAMYPYLESAGIHIEREIVEKRLLFPADQRQLTGGYFDPDRMLKAAEDAYQQARNDGYEGLWGSGDITWELGPSMDYSRLLEYEQGLESFIRDNPGMIGICQYDVGTLPRKAVRYGLLTHQSIFVSENLSMDNPYFLEPQSSIQAAAHPILLDAAIGRLCNL